MSVETRVVQVSSLGSKKLTKLSGEGWRVVSSSHGVLGNIDVILERPSGYAPPPSREKVLKQARRKVRNDRWQRRFDRLEAAAQQAKVEREAERDANRTRRSDEKAAREAKRAATPPTIPASPQQTPAVWASDPFGRHELRYWDGHRWTHHVANSGVVALDAPSRT